MPDDKQTPKIDPEILEKKVDKMMDLKMDDAKNDVHADVPELPKDQPTQAPLTAPEVPEGLSKYVDGLHTDETNETDEAIESPELPEDAPETTQTPDDIPSTDDVIESPVTDNAVTDIVRSESDVLLAVDDAKKAPLPPQKPKGIKEKIGSFFKAWWRNKKARYATIAAVLLLLVLLAMLPVSRHAILNTVGVRSDASLKIIDESTKLPLKNVHVSIGSVETKTNDEGVASFHMIRLGKQRLIVDRVAFAEINRDITIGWGSNPLGNMELKPTGARYVFSVKDYLADKPLKAEAVSEEASAFADKTGKIVLTLDSVNKETVDVQIRAEGYRTEKLSFAANQKDPTSVAMVAALPVVYVTKQSGKYDVYRIDADGKNKKLLLAGSGRERKEIATTVSPSGDEAIVVSSRGTNRDKNGYLYDTVTRIDLRSGQTQTIDEAQNIRLIDWAKDKLIYVATYAAPSASTGDRQRIVSYDMDESARSVLATSDYFNGIASIDGYIHYAIAESDAKQPASLQKIRVDGSGKQTVLQKQVWTVVRTAYNKLSLETPEGWYEHEVGSSSAAKANAPSDSYVSRQYFLAPNGAKSLWIDARDGKGALLVRDQKSGKETVAIEASGVTIPVRWLNNNTIAYRVTNANETADYVKSTLGGEARKISNVTNTSDITINL